MARQRRRLLYLCAHERRANACLTRRAFQRRRAALLAAAQRITRGSMDESLLLSIVLALALGSVMMLVNRAGYILLLLLPASQMFRLVNVKWAMALNLFVIIACVVVSLSRLPEPKGALFAGPMWVFIGLWTYGVLNPVYQNYSNMFYSLRASGGGGARGGGGGGGRGGRARARGGQ